MKTNTIIQVKFNKDLNIGDFSKIAGILLNLLNYYPDVYPDTKNNTIKYTYIFDDEYKADVYRKLNTLVGIESFEYKTII